MRIFSLMPIILLALAGCTTMRSHYSPEVQYFSEPAVNATATVGLGEAMLRQGRMAEHDTIYFEQECKISSRLAYYRLFPGYWTKEGSNKRGDFYRPSQYGNPASVRKSAWADPFQSLYIPHHKRKICAVNVFNTKICKKYEGEYQRTTQTAISDQYFQQHLIYGGGHGEKINMIYRELIHSAARSAFDHEVEYDLSESKIIGYRGARVEIINATNSEITYRVLRHFNEPGR